MVQAPVDRSPTTGHISPSPNLPFPRELRNRIANEISYIFIANMREAILPLSAERTCPVGCNGTLAATQVLQKKRTWSQQK